MQESETSQSKSLYEMKLILNDMKLISQAIYFVFGRTHHKA